MSVRHPIRHFITQDTDTDADVTFDSVALDDGTVGAPSIAFASDPDSGFYRIGANNIGLSLNGSKVVDYSTSGVSVTGVVNASTGLQVAGTTVVGAQQSAIASITDNTGGSGNDAYVAVSGSGQDVQINNNFADTAAKLNEIIAALEAHGLIAS